MFQFEVVVTERCNLNCSYCYINQQSNNMSIDTFEKHFSMLPKILKDYGHETFMTCFFGGEPLMNWELIVHAVEKLKTDPRNKGFVMPTNGLLLTPDKIDYLRKNSVNVSLSFDGLWNKTMRLDKSGKSTFDDYMTMFIDDQWPGLFQNCKIMVSPDRSTTLTENYEFFVETIENFYPDFSLVRDNIWTAREVDAFETEIEELAERTIEYIWDDKISTMPGLFSLYMLDTMAAGRFGKRPFCCFAGCQGAGFMPNGKVYPCARFGSHGIKPLYDSQFKTMINTGKLCKTETDPRTFEACRDCELYNYCNAGCTYEQIRPGNFSAPLGNLCKILKSCYFHAYRITEELKDNETFYKILAYLSRRLLNG